MYRELVQQLPEQIAKKNIIIIQHFSESISLKKRDCYYNIIFWNSLHVYESN